MEFMQRLRRAIAKLVLRGWLLRFWIRWKSRRIETLYLVELIQGSLRGSASRSIPSFLPKNEVRHVLFIADVQWESKELVPELGKICSVDVLDLHPQIQSHSAVESLNEIVTTTVADFVKVRSSAEPDLILFYARPSLLSAATFDLLRKKWKCPLVGLNLDEKMQFLNYNVFFEKNDNYEYWARHFDLNLSNVRAVVDWYGDRNLPVYYMPEGYHPKAECKPPRSDIHFDYEISFVGSKRPEREKLTAELRRLGVPIEPFGTGWERSAEGAHPERIYRASMMNLGIGLASPSERITTLKTRDFECPGSGSCYLTTFNWELGLYYEIGKDILCYRTIEELIEIFSFYRRRPALCVNIARAAYQRCLNEHTWERRFRDLFRHVGLTI
jgi:hypothetical protein